MHDAALAEVSCGLPAEARVVALVASLGGLQAISTILGELPRNLPAAVVVLQHLSPNQPSHLAELLQVRTSLRVVEAVQGTSLRGGVVTVAPPGRHLSVGPLGECILDRQPEVNFVRPSADVLLESLAARFGSRLLAVILTGRGCDGARGAAAVRQHGGCIIVQDPAGCVAPGMPEAAIDASMVDEVVRLGEIGARVKQWIGAERVEQEPD